MDADHDGGWHETADALRTGHQQWTFHVPTPGAYPQVAYLRWNQPPEMQWAIAEGLVEAAVDVQPEQKHMATDVTVGYEVRMPCWDFYSPDGADTSMRHVFVAGQTIGMSVTLNEADTGGRTNNISTHVVEGGAHDADFTSEFTMLAEGEYTSPIVISVGEDHVNPGGKAHVPVFVSDLTGFDVYSGEFSIFFDPMVLVFEGATVGDVPGIQAAYFNAHSPAPGRAEIAFAGIGALEGEGVLGTLEFFVRPNIPVGYTTPVNLEGAFNEEEMNVLIEGGAVHVSTIPVGDASKNGEVRALDASLILRHVVELIDLREDFPDEETFLRVCDVTRDGTVFPLDAARILQYVVGLIPGLPYSGKVLADAGAPRTLSVSEGIMEEDRVRVRIGLDDMTGVLAGTVRIGYDASRVRTVRAERADVLSDFLFESASGDGTLRFAFAGAEASDGPGDLAEIAFEVLPGMDVADATSSIRVLEARLNEGEVAVPPETRHETAAPVQYALSQNFPNPFNPQTAIHYALARSGAAELAIYDVDGQRIRTLVDGVREIGEHSAVWDGRDNAGQEVASGVYFCRLDDECRTVSAKSWYLF